MSCPRVCFYMTKVRNKKKEARSQKRNCREHTSLPDRQPPREDTHTYPLAHTTMYASQHHHQHHQQQPQSVSALYPQARKLQFELKMQISYLDSGRTGGKTNEELQMEARENLSQLQQLLWQLDSLVQVYPNPAERETWIKYVMCM